MAYTEYDDLPKFGDRYMQYLNPDLEVMEIRRKSRAEGNLSLTQTMEMISILLSQHQTTYIPHKTSNTILAFPFMFKRPSEGDIIVNGATDERYTIDQVIINPSTNKWNGLIKLDMIKKPSIEKRESLYFEKQDNYIEFNHTYPARLANLVGTNMENVMKNPPPMSPTITWTLIRREPGGLGKVFDSRKEFKPRIRELVKDPLVPGYTVEIKGRSYDDIVEFASWSNDHRTSERLVLWFENFLNSYTSILRQCGVNNLFFWQRPEESFNKTWRQSFAIRGSQFYFRTEELEASYERDIINIDIVLGVESSIQNRMFKEHRYIADQLVTGELTYSGYKSLFYNSSGEYQFGEIDILH